MAHGVEPVMPFDLAEATYLVPQLSKPMSTTDLIALRSIQLMKRPTELEKMRLAIWRSRKMAADEFVRRYDRNIRNYDLKPGKLVLVRNSRLEMDLGKKWKPKYLGPYVVMSKSDRGTYKLAELDGTVSNLEFAQRRVIPYHLRDITELPDAREAVDAANIED
jgi:hypothetical protein